MRRETLLSDFRQQLGRDLGFKADARRLWFYHKLPNNSRRPTTVVPPDQDPCRIADVGALSTTTHTRRSSPLDLWLGRHRPHCPPPSPAFPTLLAPAAAFERGYVLAGVQLARSSACSS